MTKKCIYIYEYHWRSIHSFVVLSMISSQILSGFNADGDHKNKRIKIMKKNLAEEFFFQSHPFSDLILLVQGISNEMYSKTKLYFFR